METMEEAQIKNLNACLEEKFQKEFLFCVLIIYINKNLHHFCNHFSCIIPSYTQGYPTLSTVEETFRFSIRYNATTLGSQRVDYLYVSNISQTKHYASINNLARDTNYSISVGLDFSVRECNSPFGYILYMVGDQSDMITAKTTNTGIYWYPTVCMQMAPFI